MYLFNSLAFKSAFSRIRGAVLLNMVGLSLGLTIIILIAVWVNHQLSYDKYHKNYERLYRIESLIDFTGEPFVWNVTPAPLSDGVKADFPEVEKSARLKEGYNESVEVNQEIFMAENLYYASSSFFDIFSCNFLEGDPINAFRDPYSIIISKREADRIYGSESAIGKTVILKNKDILTIRGVIEDFPSNSHLRINYLIPWSLLEKSGKRLDQWDQYDYYTYILLKEGIDPNPFNEKLAGYLKTKKEDAHGILFLNPIHRLYHYRDPGLPSFNYPSDTAGPIARIRLFAVIGIVILIIACINFINLSTAYATERAKEIGVRKVHGASRYDLIRQLFGESLLQTVLSMLGAVLFAVITMPLFSKISGVELGSEIFFKWQSLLMCFCLTVFTALVAGFYPAVVLSSFRPVRAMKSGPEESLLGSSLRKILVLIQFILATVFIFCILVINNQIKYMQSKDLGFDKEQMLVVFPKVDADQANTLLEIIEKLPGVSDVALGGNVPVNMGNWNTFSEWEGNTSGKSLKFHMMLMDDKYFDLMGFELASGRNLIEGTPRSEVIINEAAVKQMELSDPLGKTISRSSGQNEFTIVGIVKDFHFRKLDEEINPVFMYKSDNWYAARIFIKMEPGNQFKVVDGVCEIVEQKAPGFPVRYQFLDEAVDNYYKDEERLSTLINVATVLCIIISAIGLFSLTAFSIRRRYKEIGVRKVHGASSGLLVLLLNREFWLLLFVSTIIALPLGYFIISRWLDSYAFHIQVMPVTYLLALIISFLISTLTITIHTLRAASLNPADTLRDE